MTDLNTNHTEIRINSVETRDIVTLALADRRDTYGHAFIAAIAFELALSLDKGKFPRGVMATISERLSYDKSNLSRIGKIVRDDSTARKAVLALSFDSVNVDDVSTFDDFVTVGRLFARDTKAAKVAKATESVKAAPATSAVMVASNLTAEELQSDELDMQAMLHAWLLGSTDKQFGARIAGITAMLDTIADERAAVSAE